MVTKWSFSVLQMQMFSRTKWCHLDTDVTCYCQNDHLSPVLIRAEVPFLILTNVHTWSGTSDQCAHVLWNMSVFLSTNPVQVLTDPHGFYFLDPVEFTVKTATRWGLQFAWAGGGQAGGEAVLTETATVTFLLRVFNHVSLTWKQSLLFQFVWKEKEKLHLPTTRRSFCRRSWFEEFNL